VARRCSGPIAIGEVHGPAVALALVDELRLDTHYPFHAPRADLLARLGRSGEASNVWPPCSGPAPTQTNATSLTNRGRGTSQRTADLQPACHHPRHDRRTPKRRIALLLCCASEQVRPGAARTCNARV